MAKNDPSTRRQYAVRVGGGWQQRTGGTVNELQLVIRLEDPTSSAIMAEVAIPGDVVVQLLANRQDMGNHGTLELWRSGELWYGCTWETTTVVLARPPEGAYRGSFPEWLLDRTTEWRRVGWVVMQEGERPNSHHVVSRSKKHPEGGYGVLLRRAVHPELGPIRPDGTPVNTDPLRP